MSTTDVLICAPLRTAIGSFGGSLAALSAPELGAAVIRGIIERTKISPDAIGEVIIGSVLTAGQGQAPARQAAIKGGLPLHVQAMTVNKVCSSGLKAVMLAANDIALGHFESAIAGGMESMSNAPYLLPSLRSGARLGHATAEDSIIRDGLWDVYKNFHMGNAAEICAVECAISREMQDAFAIESYRRAQSAVKAGHFVSEILPVAVKKGKEESFFAEDEEPAKGNLDKIPTLKPVFQKDGTVTAANASSLNDGAAAMIVCSNSFARAHNLTPLARIVSQGWHAQAPEWFTTAPVGAVRHALSRASLSIENIDLFELNEAFSAMAVACQKQLEIPVEKLNIQGGAVALGHPIGASGARILTTLIHALHRIGGRYGIASLCNGGGEATALVIERV